MTLPHNEKNSVILSRSLNVVLFPADRVIGVTMGVKKELSVEERAKIVALFTDSFPKKSMRTIAVLTGHALSTICKTIQRFNK